MAINKNHEFEDLNGVKCAIVEKNVSPERSIFLKDLLEWNKYTVVIVDSPPPKIAPVIKPVAAPTIEEGNKLETPTINIPPTLPSASYTVGVTNVSFNAINAIFGRMLKTRDGKIVSLAFWLQKEMFPNNEVPYFEKDLSNKNWQ